MKSIFFWTVRKKFINYKVQKNIMKSMQGSIFVSFSVFGSVEVELKERHAPPSLDRMKLACKH